MWNSIVKFQVLYIKFIFNICFFLPKRIYLKKLFIIYIIKVVVKIMTRSQYNDKIKYIRHMKINNKSKITMNIFYYLIVLYQRQKKQAYGGITMINVGYYNKLKVSKKVDFGYYLQDELGNEVLLPNGNAKGEKVEVGDMIDVFIYRDSKDRIISTLKKPIITVGELGYLEVVSQSSIGAFVNIGLERDLFIPLNEQIYKMKTGKKYLFYMYVDKTDRLAGTTKIHDYLDIAEQGKYKVNDDVKVIVYDTAENGTLKVAVDREYIGPVSYTHLTLPTKRIVQISVGAVSLKKKKKTKLGMKISQNIDSKLYNY
eukprot:TRINITY_DN11751_c0_g1_i3.p1 TRINITY_DN11751_c0_g1~~TRINITY_DN11751_c0_g1_i3.p1  ORF type:complete len:313 (+),score=42.30 TRINITY_DN11751_c0_g1_i3:67-1005(+)